MVDEKPEPAESRKARVKELCDEVRKDRAHWKYAFERMNNWRDFARGLQWPDSTKKDLADANRLYVANVTMRHLKQRTASIYAKNPTFLARRKQRLIRQVWDGTPQQFLLAQQAVQTGADQTGFFAMVLQDAMASMQENSRVERQGQTLAYLYQHFWKEQIPPAKKMAKRQVLTSLTCGVAYFKQSFQRAMQHSPETQRAIADHLSSIAKIQRLAEEMAEGEIAQGDAALAELQEGLAMLEQSEQIILREGLTFDYPDPTNIIPDRKLTYLPGFVGCDAVTEQYVLTTDQVEEFYGVDVCDSAVKYQDNDLEVGRNAVRASDDPRETVRVWERWSRADNLIYTLCDGHDDYLREPHEPEAWTERFYPWFAYAPNAIDDPSDPFPPSDVELMMGQQMEINRAGEALRQHRWAARPGWITGENIAEEDRTRMESRKAHAVIALKAMPPDGDVRKLFQAFPTPPIDPNLYNTGPAFEDILRSVGTQEANLGGVANATATETSVAESSRQSALTSAIDEFDDLLTEMARAGSQILMAEMSPDQVRRIVGPGAIWPEQADRLEIADEIYLEVVAGSSGRPNQAQEVAIMERVYPLLFQMPGVSHGKMVEHAIKVVSDSASIEDWVDTAALPISAMTGGTAPSMQGPQGMDNTPQPPGPQGTAGPQAGQAGFGAATPPATPPAVSP